MVTSMEAMYALIMSRSHLISGFPLSQPIRMQSRVASQKGAWSAKLEDFSFSLFLHQQNMYELEIKQPKWND